MGKRKKYVEVCPQCGSGNISAIIHYGGKSYMCKDCGYRGLGVIEVVKKDVSKLKKIKCRLMRKRQR